jgi:dihydrofolate reductase
MGRKTYDSIGKPLPNRTNIVVTRSRNLEIPGCVVVNSLADAIAASNTDEAFIIGGAELYAQALPLADTLYVTEIQQDKDGDAYFPAVDESAWREVARVRKSQTEPQPLEYHFVVYERIK